MKICSYFSSDELDVKSKHYEFDKLVKHYNGCSSNEHPLYGEVAVPACTFLDNQPECFIYKVKMDELRRRGDVSIQKSGLLSRRDDGELEVEDVFYVMKGEETLETYDTLEEAEASFEEKTVDFYAFES